jgi:hypothetical protein
VIWWEIGDGHKNHYHTLLGNVQWQPNEVHHIVGTFNGSSTSNMMKIYVDGKLIKQGTPKGLVSTIAFDNGSLKIGGDFYHVYYSDFGFIDDVQIYKNEILDSFITHVLRNN